MTSQKVKKLINDNTLRRDSSIQKIPNYRVYKHNDLVECKSDFSATEHRIIVLALAQIKKTDEKLNMYKISIRDVLGNKSHTSHYNIVRNAVRRLHKSTIEMEEENGWKSYSFITKAQGQYRNNYVEIQFHEDIQKFLLGLKSQYTTYTLENVIKFRKNYSLRIYEFCKQYQKIGYRSFNLEYLKTLLSLDDKYKEFYLFKRDVLNPSVKEINTHSDIEIDFEEFRNGRKVESLTFFIFPKKNISGKTLEQDALENEISKKFFSLGFNNNEYLKLQKRYCFERLNEVLNLFEQNIDSIKLPKAWIFKALSLNYVNSSDYQQKIAVTNERLKKIKETLTHISETKREINNLKDQIVSLEEDLEFYQESGELKDSDFLRFPKECTLTDAMQNLKKRIQSCESEIRKKTQYLQFLEIQKSDLKKS